MMLYTSMYIYSMTNTATVKTAFIWIEANTVSQLTLSASVITCRIKTHTILDSSC